MPIDLSKLPEPLIHAAATRTLVPFIGSGVSRHAKNADSNPLPSWPEFVRELTNIAKATDALLLDKETELLATTIATFQRALEAWPLVVRWAKGRWAFRMPS